MIILQKLEQLITRIRAVADNGSLPFVAGELGRYKEQYQNINKVLKQFPAMVKFTAVASSKGFTDKGDTTHFDSPSAEKYGLRFATAMKRLQRKVK